MSRGWNPTFVGFVILVLAIALLATNSPPCEDGAACDETAVERPY